jgi:ectoine hydroxylase-related dioxygenase (phytanoyl-CoA dioxygenase family)
MPDLQRSKPADGSEAILAALLDDGGVIVEDLLPRELLDAVNEELDPHVESADPGMEHINPAIGFFFGTRTRHVSGVAGKSRRFAVDVMCHPLFLELCDRILLPSCAHYQLNLAHVIDRGPGAEAQLLHRDQLVWNLVPKPHPELQVATILALEDFTDEIGATQLAPGSHRWEPTREAEEEEIVTAEMPAGSAVIYLGSTIHRGGANRTTDRWRRGVHMSYTLGWLRTEENNVLAVPPEIARGLPERAQELLGYRVHDAIRKGGGYLGMVDLKDPVEMLQKGEL